MNKFVDFPNKQLFDKILRESEYDKRQRNLLDNLLQSSNNKPNSQVVSNNYSSTDEEPIPDGQNVDMSSGKDPKPVTYKMDFEQFLDNKAKEYLKNKDTKILKQ
jgi:hypothetical protein